jgi:hypothetical protein
MLKLAWVRGVPWESVGRVDVQISSPLVTHRWNPLGWASSFLSFGYRSAKPLTDNVAPATYSRGQNKVRHFFSPSVTMTS